MLLRSGVSCAISSWIAWFVCLINSSAFLFTVIWGRGGLSVMLVFSHSALALLLSLARSSITDRFCDGSTSSSFVSSTALLASSTNTSSSVSVWLFFTFNSLSTRCLISSISIPINLFCFSKKSTLAHQCVVCYIRPLIRMFSPPYSACIFCYSFTGICLCLVIAERDFNVMFLISELVAGHSSVERPSWERLSVWLASTDGWEGRSEDNFLTSAWWLTWGRAPCWLARRAMRYEFLIFLLLILVRMLLDP